MTKRALRAPKAPLFPSFARVPGNEARAAEESDVLRALLLSLEARGDHDAIIAFAADGAAAPLSYAALASLTARFAHKLRGHGVTAGAAVGVLAENGVPGIVARLALIALGAVAINPDPDSPAEEIKRELTLARAALLLATPQFLKSAQRAFNGALPIVRIDRESLDGAPPAAPASLAPERVPVDDPAAIFFTSGTTGPPKGVPLSRRNMGATVQSLERLKLLRASDRVLLPLPLHHSYPFLVGLLVTLASGATLVLPAGLSGPQLGHALRAGEVSVIVGVPRLYEALMQSIESRLRAEGAPARLLFEAMLRCAMLARRAFGIPLGRLLFRPLYRKLGPRLSLMASGGARLDAEVAARLEGLGFTVLEGYGLVETASVSTFNPPGRTRLGSVGLPAPGVEIRIDAPDEDGQGEILIRGPNVFAGYLRDDEATARAFAEGDWFRSGDIGRLDRDGYLWVTGRKKEIFVLPDGKKIAPEELEAVYGASPLVREVALLETPDGVQALVVPNLEALRDSAASPEDAIRVALSEIAQTLPPFKRLAGFALQREPLPRTHLGKYARRALPALFVQAKRHERKPAGVTTAEDQTLLDDPKLRPVWDWLQARFAGRALDLDTSPQLDLGIDSLGWVALSLDIKRQFGIELSEEAVARIVTLRDLLRAVAQAPAAAAAPEAPPARDAAEEMRALLAPPGFLRRTAALALFAAVWIAARLLFRLEAQGAEKIPASRPLIIAANHASDLDPFVLAASLPLSLLQDCYWGGDAARLFGTRARRAFARTVHVFPIDDRAPLASLARARAVLEAGKALIWFPESWRSPNGALQRFLPGVGRLLRETEAAVVPAYISGTFAALPRHARRPRLVPVRVTFGALLSFQALRAKAGENTDSALANALREEIAKLAQQAEQEKGTAQKAG